MSRSDCLFLPTPVIAVSHRRCYHIDPWPKKGRTHVKYRRMSIFFLLLLLQLSFPSSTHSQLLEDISSIGYEIQRVLIKRDAIDNVLKDNQTSKCRNGGIWAGSTCHCIHPHTGPTCQDFACVHGISVGRRFDPNSMFFSKPCICNDGWKGDLCEFHLTDRCNQRGEWKSGKCECIGSFFGDACQYTSRCEFGTIKHGRCICQKHFQGDYCERAVCYHGYHNHQNHSRSCTCPNKYKGTHCDQCAQVGKHILPYPKCVVDFVPPEQRHMRKKAKHQNKSRIFIIFGAIGFLGIMGTLMILLHLYNQKRRNVQEDARRAIELEERKEMLEKAAAIKEALANSEAESVQNTITKKERRISLPNIFRLRHSASSDRVLRIRELRSSLPREDTF